MTDGLPVQSTEKWTFHLQLAQPLQFRITPAQGASDDIVIEGHDISALLDYLYDNRELIYDATHDQETRHLEAMEAFDAPIDTPLKEWQIERLLYVDDGVQRIQIQTSEKISHEAHQ